VSSYANNVNIWFNAEQSGKLECIYVIAKMRPHFLICCGAESPASMEDLPLWKFEDRVETFSTKDPALAFSGQKAAQVNASHFLLLWPPWIMPYSPSS
jgi:hypothetical protein